MPQSSSCENGVVGLVVPAYASASEVVALSGTATATNPAATKLTARHIAHTTDTMRFPKPMRPPPYSSTQMVAAVMPRMGFEMVGRGPKRLNTPWKRPL